MIKEGSRPVQFPIGNVSYLGCTLRMPSWASWISITLHVLLMAASTPIKSSWSLCFFSYQHKVGCMGMSQHINSSKVLFPGQMNLTEEAERLAVRHEAERLAALKFIHAISHPINLLSNGRLEIQWIKWLAMLSSPISWPRRCCLLAAKSMTIL